MQRDVLWPVPFHCFLSPLPLLANYTPSSQAASLSSTVLWSEHSCGLRLPGWVLLPHMPAVGLWAARRLNHSFHVCKKGVMITPPSQECFQDEITILNCFKECLTHSRHSVNVLLTVTCCVHASVRWSPVQRPAWSHFHWTKGNEKLSWHSLLLSFYISE